MSQIRTRRSFLKESAAAFLGVKQVPAQAAKRPNILFVIADDWSYGHSGAYGATWLKTPNFDRIAAEGVRFTHCFTSNPKCSPCRATILTGRNSWQLKEAVSHNSIMPRDFVVYPDILEKAGYFTGYTGKGWGPGDFQSTGWPHNPAGREFQKYTLQPLYTGISNKDYARNFEYFLSQKPKDQPFCFWLGAQEPHRVYEEGSGIRAGRNPADVTVPPYFPDNRTVRSDMLDYALEVEWFDQQLGKAIRKLEEAGELDNTFIVVTSDHGMPFPRVKGQIFEEGFHIPLAIRWGKHIAGGRVIDDFINTRDFAPTFLELAGANRAPTITGKSFLDILQSGKAGEIDPTRSVMLIAKERHDLGRPNDWGYPVRAIRTKEYLYIHNYEPSRWPAGDPETGYRNVDDGPTKAFMLSSFDRFYQMSFGKRPEEALYLVNADPHCMKNLAADPAYRQTKTELRTKMEEMLKAEGDPRLNGNASFFDTIRYVGPDKHSYRKWVEFSKQP